MSDTPLGPQWWRASDDKWYPPQPLPPGSPPPNRNALIGVVAVLAVIAVIGLLVIVTDGGSSDDTAAPPDTQPVDNEPGGAPSTDPPPDPAPDTTTTTTTEPEAPAGAGTAIPGDYVTDEVELGDDLVILEYGYSTVEDRLTSGLLTLGLVLENRSSEPRIELELHFDAYDENDQLLTTGQFRGPHTVQAGETLQIGHYVREGADRNGTPVDGTIDRLEFRYGGHRGFERADGRVEVSDVTFQPWGNDGTGWEVRFAATSTYAYELEAPRAYVVFRNSDGEILGGHTQQSPDHIPTDGESRGEILAQFNYSGLDIDPDQSDVYVEGGFSHP